MNQHPTRLDGSRPRPEKPIALPPLTQVPSGAGRNARRHLATALIAAVLVACRSDGPTIPPDAARIDATHEFRFAPADTTVAAGTRIVWVNGSLLEHTITPIEHSAWGRGELARRNDIFEIVLSEPGIYPYVCEFHQGEGMLGRIVVE